MKNIVFLSVFFVSFSSFSSTLHETMASIEKRISGRIGVSILETHNQNKWEYKGNERFPMMSTFKTLACAKMLKDSEKGVLDKNTLSLIDPKHLIAWSPVTEPLAGGSITLEKACEATMFTSDNTAANIVLQHIGGPQALTLFLRSIGDPISQLDRIEPDLNQARLDDIRDTSTPNSMNETLKALLFGGVLNKISQDQLLHWMQGNVVSNGLLRSILPKGWSIADRAGAGGFGSRGMTAVIWTTTRKPLIISIYMTQTALSMPERDKVMNEIAQHILTEFAVK